MGKKGKAGGKPKGRAGQKQKAQKKGSNASWAHDFVRSSHQLLDDTDDNPHKLFKGFAQGGPAPSKDFMPRNPSVKLRHQAISFVSAGTNMPKEQEDSTLMMEEDSDELELDVYSEGEEDDNQSTIQTNILADTDADISEGAMAKMNIQSSADLTGPDTDGTSDVEIVVEKKPEPESLSFFVDTIGDAKLDGTYKAKGKQPVPRQPSPARSDSSEEVVFHGRNKPTVVNDPFTQPSRNKASIPQPEMHKPHVTDSLLAALDAPSSFPQTASSVPASGWAAKPSKLDAQRQPEETWTPAPSTPYWKKAKPRPDLDPSPAEKMTIENMPVRESKVLFAEPTAAAEEPDAEATIASLQADWKRTLREKKSDLKPHTPNARRGKRGRRKDNRQLRAAQTSDDEDDDDAADQDYLANLMTQLDEEDPEGEIKAVLASGNILTPSEAVRGSAMVVDGKAYGDHEVFINHASDEWEDDSSNSDIIGQDLSELSDNDDDASIDQSDLDSSDLEEALEYTEREQWEDEADLRQRRQDGMSDERLARMWAKQQELGIDADELVIDDGYISDDLSAFGDIEEARAGLEDITNSSFARPTTRTGPSRRRRQGGHSFPNASALADTVEQYGESGFDIMDFERPSLRSTKKGRKGKLPAELDTISDDELKENLNGQWENDRAKKRMKKAERETLRAEGMLGASGRKGKADLSQKYLEGMSMAQVFDELRLFLQNDGQTTRPFPPMAKNDRKALHDVANALDLKSKSVGSGKTRAPVLYKTSFTMEYDEYTFRQVMQASSRGFYKNSAYKGKKGMKGSAAKKSRPGAGGGFSKSAVGLRHGEIVGAGAKEIGTESFGHKLMEKMGWTKGTALGKDGEGMLVPVAQVMRSGKAGLG